jgi:hypothetical protein
MYNFVPILKSQFYWRRENGLIRPHPFHGLNIKETVPVDQEKSYFKIKVNGVNKFLHKSTACYLLTKDNNSLFADRLSRVIQTSKK